MICNRKDLDAAIDWLTREEHQAGKPCKRDTCKATYRGWTIYETDEVAHCYGSIVYALTSVPAADV